MKNSQNLRLVFVAVLLAVVIPIGLWPNRAEAASCSFTRDLQVGVNGEDTRCLQKFLNSNGFQIAKSGVGSPGNETSIFGTLTKQAVKKWQAANGVSASGMFGPISRKKFASLTAANPSVPTTPSSNTAAAVTPLTTAQINAKIASVLAQIENLKSKRDKLIENKVTKTDAKDALAQTETDINKAQNEVDAAYRKGDSVDKANDYLRDAKEKLADAKRSYNKDNYDEVMSYVYETEKLVDKALKDIDSDTVTGFDAKDAIDQAKKALIDSEAKVNQSEDVGNNIDKAQNKLTEAQTELDKAENYYDKNDYVNAEAAADRSESLSDDAVDAITNISKSEARNKITEADDAIDDAVDDIAHAKDRNRSVGNAESILNNAKSALTTARNYYDSKNYTEAAAFANKAIRYVNDALDQF